MGYVLSDGDGLTLGRSVGLGSLSEGGSLRAEGGVDICGNSGGDNSVVPVRSPSLGCCNESEDGEDRLEGLHLDENDCLFL